MIKDIDYFLKNGFINKLIPLLSNYIILTKDYINEN